MADTRVSHPVRRSTGHLADGRELMYDDDSEPFVSGGTTRSFADRRRMAAHRTDTEMRCIAAWHAAPVREDPSPLALHLHVFSITWAPGKMKYLTGSESGMGAWISDTMPERIAARLRDVG